MRHHIRKIRGVLLLFVLMTGVSGSLISPAFCKTGSPAVVEAKRLNPHDRAINEKIENLLRRMTLDEKIGQMTLFTSSWDTTGPAIDQNYMNYIRSGKCGAVFNAYTASYTKKLQAIAVGETRLSIPLLFGYDVIHGHRTIFPIPLAESCSWDLAAMEKSARIAAIEASAEGIHWTFAPMVDITRDPRWGRVSEGAGEDTWLGCLIAKARVKGFQGGDLAAVDTIAACAKHFAAYGAPEAGRDYNVVDISERTLEETYLPPYKACVDAGVRTFMTAFNEIAGEPCTANRKLLTELLRRRWGFNGFIVTDYTAINELIPHGVAGTLREAGKLAARAGVDMDMQGAVYMNHLADLVRTGFVDESSVDDAVRRILRVKFELGLFDDPYRYCSPEREKSLVFSPKHLQAAREMARKSIVLLKNDRGVLPLRTDIGSLAVIGPLAEATTDLLGNWHAAGDGSKVTPVLRAVREKMRPGCQVLHAKGCEVEGTDRSGFQKALSVARQADVILLVLGERENMSGEAASRSDIDLPGVQNELAEAVARLNKPVVAVLVNGRPLVLSRLHEAVPAILEAWFPGSMGGKAIADVLFGEFNPSAKLTMTFPRNGGQIPIYYNEKPTGRPLSADKYTSKYLDVPNSPLFPFGHGLSYTTFAYENFHVQSSSLNYGETLNVSVDVKNTGGRDGEEIVQCYLRDLVGSVTRPMKQLKGFRKVFIKTGEKATVSFAFTSQDFAFLRADGYYGTEPGEFEVSVGSSSASLLKASFTLNQ